ncbi:unnamed protein product [Urochloa humidicola]
MTSTTSPASGVSAEMPPPPTARRGGLPRPRPASERHGTVKACPAAPLALPDDAPGATIRSPMEWKDVVYDSASACTFRPPAPRKLPLLVYFHHASARLLCRQLRHAPASTPPASASPPSSPPSCSPPTTASPRRSTTPSPSSPGSGMFLTLPLHGFSVFEPNVAVGELVRVELRWFVHGGAAAPAT